MMDGNNTEVERGRRAVARARVGSLRGDSSDLIQLTGVTKTHGVGSAAVSALKSIDLRIQRGEFVSIMGPSGSGKSTLLHLISALDTPTSGTIAIQGQDISKLSDDELTLFRRRKLGLVFQFINLLPTLNVLDNVLLPVSLERKVATRDRTRALGLLDEVGLGTRTGRFIHELSGGEMQRVAIARALIMEPSLLLADEPTGNLDSKTGSAILALLQRISESKRVTIIMVTHDAKAALVGQLTVALQDGRVVSDEINGEKSRAVPTQSNASVG